MFLFVGIFVYFTWGIEVCSRVQ